MDTSLILKKITDFYLNSRDFNGKPIDDLNSDFETTTTILRELLINGEIVLNFGDRHPNPHILAFEPESIKEQIDKLNAIQYAEPIYEDYGPIKIHKNSIGCCAYPSKSHLKKVVKINDYNDKPYSLLLALGEPQLSHRSFNLRVLEFYRNDPRYSYWTNDISGSISAHDDTTLGEEDVTFLQTFGFAYDKKIKNRFVAVFLKYLNDLTPDHQQRWKLEEFKSSTFLHPDYARTAAGFWPEKESIFLAFCEELNIINEMTKSIYGRFLFKKSFSPHTKPREFSFLVRPTKKEFEEFVSILDKLISENLDYNFFRDKVEMKKIIKKGEGFVEQDKGTIVLLEEWLNSNNKFLGHVNKNKMLKTFKTIRKDRSKPAHYLSDNELNNEYFVKQRKLIIDAYMAIRTLRLILANHPLAKQVQVPDWLSKGEIWTF